MPLSVVIGPCTHNNLSFSPGSGICLVGLRIVAMFSAQNIATTIFPLFDKFKC